MRRTPERKLSAASFIFNKIMLRLRFNIGDYSHCAALIFCNSNYVCLVVVPERRIQFLAGAVNVS